MGCGVSTEIKARECLPGWVVDPKQVLYVPKKPGVPLNIYIQVTADIVKPGYWVKNGKKFFILDGGRSISCDTSPVKNTYVFWQDMHCVGSYIIKSSGNYKSNKHYFGNIAVSIVYLHDNVYQMYLSSMDMNNYTYLYGEISYHSKFNNMLESWGLEMEDMPVFEIIENDKKQQIEQYLPVDTKNHYFYNEKENEKEVNIETEYQFKQASAPPEPPPRNSKDPNYEYQCAYPMISTIVEKEVYPDLINITAKSHEKEIYPHKHSLHELDGSESEEESTFEVIGSSSQ